MKEFLKWLGVNEKVAKVGMWMFIFMAFLIIFNTFLESIGLPFYRITYENLSKIEISYVKDCLVSWVTAVLNFYTFMLIIFRTKEAKAMIKYSVIYLALNIIIASFCSDLIVQAFIMLYVIGTAYIHSGRKPKYILYAIISILINAAVQYVSYAFKIRFIDYTTLNNTEMALVNIDYFIIMAIIIWIKELYLKNKNEKQLK